MAKKTLVDSIIKLYSKLGGNISDVLGTRSNVNFLGTGKSPEGFIDGDINIEAIGVLGKTKILDELKSSMGYLTSDKLNDVQASKLYENMTKIDEVLNPKQIPNITDMATGIRNLDQEGIASLRAEQKLADDIMTDISDAEYTIRGYFPKASDAEIKKMLDKPSKKVMEILDVEGVDLPPPGSRGGADDIATPVQDAETTIRNLEKQDPELAAQFKAMMIGGNQGGNPSKRATAREFLVEALKKDEYDVGTAAFGKTNLNNIISAEDVKYITEGGGGIGGDPLLLVEKYFGPRIRDLVPEGASSEEIIIFTKRVLENVEDAAGLKPDNPRFDRMTARFVDEMADGGRAGFFAGGLGRLGKAGYQAIRKYGIEAEDITDLFKSLATDKTLVGKEKTEYFKMLNQVLKNPDDYPDGVREILMRLGKPVDFKSGGLAKILEV